MEIFKHRISNWWLALIVPVLLVVLLMTPLTLIILGHAAGAVIGPPALWRMPREMPDRNALVGTYVESSNNVYGRFNSYSNVGGIKVGSARITLNGDGSMTAQDLPIDDPVSWNLERHGICLYSVQGTWATRSTDPGLAVDLNPISQVPPSLSMPPCNLNYAMTAAFMGQSQPYSIYWSVGDPDSGVGIEFRQTK
jgi:hypothetical protein